MSLPPQAMKPTINVVHHQHRPSIETPSHEATQPRSRPPSTPELRIRPAEAGDSRSREVVHVVVRFCSAYREAITATVRFCSRDGDGGGFDGDGCYVSAQLLLSTRVFISSQSDGPYPLSQLLSL
ncbi:hypothetical protein Dimus_037113 [Dionaea muscipula]